MKTRSAITFGPLTLGLSALLLTGGAIGVGANIAAASARDQSRAEKHARTEASEAQQALAHGKYDLATRHAEAAVGFQPQAAAYRMILGQSYLKSGRFASARDAFSDALTLDGTDGRAALHFALAQIATGDWAGARKTLDAHADTISVADRGLGMALAGDPAAAVELLAPAARQPTADAKLRQNLALSLALAGRWQEAKTVIAIDVAADQVDKRIMEWATFSRPKSASDQVASLLGVTPAVDPGLPVALALNSSASGALAAAAPVEAFMPGKSTDAPVVAEVAPVPVAAPAPVVAEVAPAPVEVAAAAPSIAGIVFGARHEVVQALPVAVAAAPKTPSTKAVAKVRPAIAVAAIDQPKVAGKGSFYIQIGAFQNAGVARDAWGRASHRFARFAGQTPQGMSVKTAAGSFYRLSVGGYARGDAVALCGKYRAAGGVCFVRASAGDQVAAWASKGRELASR